jgi:hypothetical protein
MLRNGQLSQATQTCGWHRCSPGRESHCRRCLTILRQANRLIDFLESFPSVTREQVIAFLGEVKDRVIEAAS